MFRSNSSAEYIARASKVVTLVDLAGHERYFKTTAYGLTGHLPDYACLIVGANAGSSEALLKLQWYSNNCTKHDHKRYFALISRYVLWTYSTTLSYVCPVP